MITINLRVLKYPLIVLVILGVLFGVRWCFLEGSYRVVEAQVKNRISRGFMMLAAEVILEHRDLFESKEAGCKLSLTVFSTIGNAGELTRAGEKCSFEGFDMEEIPLAMAQLAKASGRQDQAALILNRARERFPSSWQIALNEAETLIEGRQYSQAAKLLHATLPQFQGEPKFLMGAFQAFQDCSLFDDARALAPRIEAMPQDLVPPTIKRSLERLRAVTQENQMTPTPVTGNVSNEPRFLPGKEPGTSYIRSKDGRSRFGISMSPEEAEKKYPAAEALRMIEGSRPIPNGVATRPAPRPAR